ncbi:TIGR04255 family protein [Sphingomonas melonis]|uniref:Uncharacterized protein (TIGR04255 family) n=1 Tax=Sphingomonas melonis TaxID=152682 RepID=A0A7Y9FQH9_9SPHN|nr:uncharacterized protein (TIGR04255 family) [Sphingomonas melonis]
MKTTATEVVIALQFADPLPHLNAIQIASITDGFAEFPRFAELPVSGPMPYSLEQLDGTEPINGFVASFPRIALGSEDGDRTLTFQADRLTYSWVRTAELLDEDDYPGFDELVKELQPVIERFATLVQETANVTVSYKVAELTYVNVIPTRTPDNEPIRLSTLFAFLAPVPNSPGVNGYFHAWNEKLGVAEGVLRLQVNGPVLYAPEKPGASFTLAGTFLISDAQQLPQELLAVRQRIGETYGRVLATGSAR